VAEAARATLSEPEAEAEHSGARPPLQTLAPEELAEVLAHCCSVVESWTVLREAARAVAQDALLPAHPSDCTGAFMLKAHAQKHVDFLVTLEP